ncbi:MAG: hypothetical protein ACKOU6_04635, partial [Planctomycetota bacterium]
DEAARLEYAINKGRQEGLRAGRRKGRRKGRLEGEKIGLQRGELIGQIRILEQFLNLTPTTSEEMAELNIDSLTTRVTELQQLLRERRL